MVGARASSAILFFFPFGACWAEDEFLGRVLEKAREHMSQLPDFVCGQTIERSERVPAQDDFRLKDRLHLEVTSLGGQERFAKAGGAKFDDRELRDLVTRGIVATGGHALFLRHVTQQGSAEFHPGTEAEFDGRAVRRYDFQVPWERSGYTISLAPNEARVAFRGFVLADPDTHDIVRLEIIADEIPPELGFDRTHSSMAYRYVNIGPARYPFAVDTETVAVMLDGKEYRNRSALGACRKYSTESNISFASTDDVAAAPASDAAALAQEPIVLRSNLLLEIELSDELAFASSAPDTLFRATLTQPLRDGERIIAPAGSIVHGRVLELARVSKPVDRYEVVLRLDSIALAETSGGQIPLIAKLHDTGGAPGLIRQEKKMMPAFSKKRGNRFTVLVRESGPDQAVLYWDARHPQIRRGFRMRWLTGSTE